jgi:tetratricopeptide (TPR) repeat protein
MTRTERYKIQYFASIAGYAAIVAVLLWQFGLQPITIIVVALLLFVPGRVQGFLWRDLYTGRRLLESGSFSSSLSASERFVQLAKSRPWLRKLWWLQGAIYTRDPVAMAQNNIGAAHLELKQFDEAKRAFSDAISLDAEYAVPHFNLAMIAGLEEDEAEKEHRLNRAAALGYSQSVIDNFVKNAGSILARFEGASKGRPNPDVGS